MRVSKQKKNDVLNDLEELYDNLETLSLFGRQSIEMVERVIGFIQQQRKSSRRVERIEEAPDLLRDIWSVDGYDQMLPKAYLSDCCSALEKSLGIDSDKTLIAVGKAPWVSAVWRVLPSLSPGTYLQVLSPWRGEAKPDVFLLDYDSQLKLMDENRKFPYQVVKGCGKILFDPVFLAYGGLVRKLASEYEREGKKKRYRP